MMHHDTPTANLVRNLRSVGLRPNDKLIEQILARGQEAEQALLEIALDTEALKLAEPTSLAPLHALRLLGELRPVAAAEPLLRKLPLPDDLPSQQSVYLWSQEVPQIVARFGPDVLPLALQIADDETAPSQQREAALETLAYLTATEPSLRDQIVSELRTRLAQESNPEMKAFIVAALADIGASEVYAEVMAAYRAGSIDRDVISAAEARQSLLGPAADRRIHCAKHTLAERYEQHGPYSEEQQRAMAEMLREQGRV
jgi:hypothetical protein